MTPSSTTTRGLRTVVIIAMILIELGTLYGHWGDVREKKPDFAALYGTAAVIRTGKPPDYNPSTIKGIDVGYDQAAAPQAPAVKTDSLHPPFEYLLFLPFTFLSYRAAYLAWYACNLILLWCTPLVLWPFLRNLHRDFHFIAILLGSMLTVVVCLILGQDSLLLLLLIAAAYVSQERNQYLRSGFFLGLAMFKFQFVLPILAVFLLARMWKVVAGFGIALFALTTGSFAMIGVRPTLDYLPFVFAFGKHISSNASARTALMPNTRGLVSLILGGALNPRSQTILILLISAAVFGIVAYWYLTSTSRPLSWRFAGLVTMSSLVSYHDYVYNAVLLILPLLLFANDLADSAAPRAFKTTFAATAIAIYVVPVLTPLNIGVSAMGVASLCLLALLLAYPKFAHLAQPPAMTEAHRAG
jgi:hypothetical protein